MVWRMKKLGVNLKAYLVENWCHGVLSFDLKIGGIPESHKSNLLNVEFFREIFNETKILSNPVEGSFGILTSPMRFRKKFGSQSKYIESD